jgi:hypothetical protein
VSLFIIVFALLGAVVGDCVGVSREPVVGTVIPAVLTLFAAFGGYAFTNEGLAKIRPVIPFCLFALVLLTLHWVFVGAKPRLSYEIWHARFEKVDLAAINHKF